MNNKQETRNNVQKQNKKSMIRQQRINIKHFHKNNPCFQEQIRFPE